MLFPHHSFQLLRLLFRSTTKIMSAMEVDQSSSSVSPAKEPVVTGIIYPPPDIRKMIDKAAANLSTKGPELENHIRETNKDGRFNFLHPNDPYYAYYRFKYNEFKEVSQETIQTAEKQEPVEAVQSVSQAPKEPEPFEFSATIPAMSAQDLDIMKLTAQFAARNGRAFINQLAQRESRNYQFDFLRPSHSLFPYFTELVKQYTKVFLPPKDLQEKLRAVKNNKYQILDKVKERVEWNVWQEAERKKKSDEDEKERIAYASIDWHDFVVVETVEFTDVDEQAELPPPMSLAELESMSLAQKRLAAMPSEALAELDKEVTDEGLDEDVEMEQSDEEPIEHAASTATAAPLPTPAMPIKIRTDYKPRLLGVTAATNIAKPTELCPRCGEAIPVDEMAEHMRVELLDPKWKEQKMAMENKNRGTNLLEGADVAKNLKRITRVRPDIFGGAEETDVKNIIKEMTEEAKQKEKVMWDGHTATMAMATQMAKQRKPDDQVVDQPPQIGPFPHQELPPVMAPPGVVPPPGIDPSQLPEAPPGVAPAHLPPPAPQSPASKKPRTS
ncbi:Pre-mRNA splicing factor PRP21 like protein-domain-containing protein [Mycotypha africana]|uniref:Pre-mRNA splicing factor PRP21 like protein-domain-containing protein n=1 Tax=Mycotypha africana TaxID=64632 RepID=UPI002301FA49|nr:Pre-mRNA splicing factor PRP21 like protein-domain-containing protein [Mycotypha africana]KAI8968958.1 Pre-mRNA splicing factor PRP21 like protein-domain-containing protein [Mycotypha africana]